MDLSTGNHLIGSHVDLVPMDSNRNIIIADNMKIGLIGVNDLTIVVKDDLILICCNPKLKDEKKDEKTSS